MHFGQADPLWLKQKLSTATFQKVHGSLTFECDI